METKENQDRRHPVVIFASIVSLVFLVASALLVTAYAQSDSQAEPAGATIGVTSKQLGTDPSTDSSASKVTLQLTFDNGAVFKATQFEGEMIRVERNGSTIEIVPHVDIEHGNQVTATVLKVVHVEPAITVEERITETSSIEISREASDLPIGDLGAKIAVIRIAYEPRPPNDRKKISRLRLPNGEGGGGVGFAMGGQHCCVTCAGITMCACAVEAPCGSCCAGSCC